MFDIYDACLARNTFKEFGRSLGFALAHVCGDFRPESFILAGNIVRSSDIVIEGAKLSYLSEVLLEEDNIKPVLRQSKLIDTN